MKLLKLFAILSMVTTLAACGCPRNGKDGATGAPGAKGDTGQTGAPGQDGANGQDGADGSNGHSMVFSTAAASNLQCSNGGSILMIGVDLDDNGQLDITDGNVQTLVTCNGLNGSNGQDGHDGANGHDGQNAPPTQFTPVGIIDPCGTRPGIWNEVFLKLQDGTILASFSDNANGQNTRFSILRDGTYHTTDGDNCVFTLSGGVITYENHHY